ncbi:MAG: UDP-N-acetylglucosamine 2-epimerase [Muribaculaceae bacterium]|jgi:UDP-hydrolysing UDP-N-acetyl-D-glucosamine 2-epimerase|nr:UDP-N-acetylglucosamine 2-epimerase [Muribaculaceae bacterium]
MKKICVITGTRAEYGLLSKLMKRIDDCPDMQLQIIATNMHLSPEFGLTYREIEADGFHIDKKVEMLLSSDTRNATTKSLGLGIIGFADAFEDLAPDMVVILGDRYEMLGAASAALLYGIPIAHISGGDVTEGAYDDAIRHSISKMSHLHFTSAEEYRQRVIQLGEQPDRVFNFGAIGLDNMRQIQFLDRQSLEQSIGFEIGEDCILVTYHPVTMERNSAETQFGALLEAIDRVGCRVIFTKPNSDSDGRIIIKMIDEYVAANSDKAACYTSLGYVRYLSALQFVKAAVGNSSSGILEVPSFGIPTVNIGDRQKGRLRADSVIDCNTDVDSIEKSIRGALSQEWQTIARNATNPYEQPDTVARIFEVLQQCDLSQMKQKRFYDIR